MTEQEHRARLLLCEFGRAPGELGRFAPAEVAELAAIAEVEPLEERAYAFGAVFQGMRERTDGLAKATVADEEPSAEPDDTL